MTSLTLSKDQKVHLPPNHKGLKLSITQFNKLKHPFSRVKITNENISTEHNFILRSTSTSKHTTNPKRGTNPNPNSKTIQSRRKDQN